MNPQQPAPASPTPAPPAPPHHAPSNDELLELGMLAIEDANQAELSAAPTPPPAATPPAPPLVVTPAPASSLAPSANDDVLAASPATVVTPTAATAMPADEERPAPPGAGPDAWDKAAFAALPVQPVAEAKPSGVPSPAPVEMMEYSANSSQIKSISRLRRVSLLLYVVIITLAAGIIIGGYFIYQKLGSNF